MAGKDETHAAQDEDAERATPPDESSSHMSGVEEEAGVTGTDSVGEGVGGGGAPSRVV